MPINLDGIVEEFRAKTPDPISITIEYYSDNLLFQWSGGSFRISREEIDDNLHHQSFEEGIKKYQTQRDDLWRSIVGVSNG